MSDSVAPAAFASAPIRSIPQDWAVWTGGKQIDAAFLLVLQQRQSLSFGCFVGENVAQAAEILDAECRMNSRSSHIGINDEHPRSGLREANCQIERCGRLAFSGNAGSNNQHFGRV